MEGLTGAYLLSALGTPVNNTSGNSSLSGGFLTAANQQLGILNQVTGTPASNFGPGTFGFFNPKTWLSVGSSNPPTDCCPLVFAAASFYSKDKLNDFQGRYQRLIMSKEIYPSLVKGFYRIDSCAPQPGIYHIGQTPATSSSLPPGAILDLEVKEVNCSSGSIPTTATNVGSLSIVSSANSTASLGSFAVTIQNLGGGQYGLAVTPGGSNFTVGDLISGTVGSCTITFEVTSVDVSSDCCFDFLCDSSYPFLFQLYGTPAYQAFYRPIIRELMVQTPCCDPGSNPPLYVDPLWVYWQLALQIAQDPQLNKFIYPIVVLNNGTYFYPDQELYPELTIPSGANTFSDIPAALLSNSATSFCGTRRAGIILQTAYVETRFGNCTFVARDGYTYDPVRLRFSLRHYEKDTKCSNGICFFIECQGHQGEGSGESVLRDLMHSEWHRTYNAPGLTDLRMREIEFGNDLINAVNRNGRYTKYILIFDVRRQGNWAQAEPFEEWRLNLYTASPNTAFETFVNAWLTPCGCNPMQVINCNRCDISIDPSNLASPSTNQ